MPSSALSIKTRPSLLFWPDEKETTEKIIPLPSKEITLSDFGTRFGSIDLTDPHTPHDVGLSTDTTRLAFLSNRQIYKKVIEWFETWRPWQQRILLCGITNRCSTNQLESLATTLEPIFHRDFVMTVKQRYPSACLKKTMFMPPVQKKSKAKKKGKNKVTSKTSLVSKSTGTLNQSVQNSAGTSDKREMTLSGKVSLSETNIKTEQTLTSLEKPMGVSGDNAPTGIESEQSVLNHTTKEGTMPLEKTMSLDDFAGNLADTVVEGSLSQIEKKVVSRQLSSLSDNLGNLSLPKREETESLISGPLSGKTKVSRPEIGQGNLPRLSTKLSKRNPTFTTDRTASTLTRSLPKEGMDMLKYDHVEWNRFSTQFPTQHHNAWLRHSMPSNPSSASSLRASAAGHRHRSALKPTEGHSNDFFKGDKYYSMGPYQTEMRTGAVKRPDQLEDVYVPIQRMYKSSKWFPESPRDGVSFVRPKTSVLKLHFREQINQIWQWMSTWEDYEKLALLKEILKLCNSSLITYLAQCLFTRLEERKELNWLPDRLLLLTFTYLSIPDLNICSQVCRRWRYLTQVDELWMVKCHEYGVASGISNVTQQIVKNSAKFGEEVDWRLALYELQDITKNARLTVPVPRQLSIEAATPDGMVRVYGKFIPVLHDSSEDSSVREIGDFDDDVDLLTPGLASKLVHESDKLKKSYRQMLQNLREKEERTNEERIKSEQALYEKQDPKMEEQTPSVDSKTGSRMALRRAKNLRTSSQLSSFSVGDSLSDEIDRTMAELGMLKNELDAVKEDEELPPKTLEEWISRRAEDETAQEISLDVRHEITQAEEILANGTSSEDLFKQSSLDVIEIKKSKKKDKNEKEEFIIGVKASKRLYGHMDSVITMVADKRRLVTGSLDRNIRVWDIRTGVTIHKLCGHKGAVTCFAFDNEVLYSGSWDCSVMVWDMVHFTRLSVLYGHKGSVSCLAHHNDLLLSGSHDGTVRVWCKTLASCLRVMHIHKLHITCMQLEGKFVYTGGSDGCIKVSQIERGDTVQVFPGHSEPINSLLIQGDLIVSTNPKGQVWFWHKDKGRAEAAIQAHRAPVNVLRFYKERFYTGSSDMTIKEWDLKTMTCLRSFVGHKGAVNSLLFEGSKMVSCDSGGAVRTWDFSVQLMPLGNTKSAFDGVIDHNVVDEKDLLRGAVTL